MFKIIFVVIVLYFFLSCVHSWGSDADRIYLQDVKVITLHRGRLTTGRRSSGVPQLKCVGGSAGCSAFVPDVVQCQNVGSDGFDAQWKCETDMDDSYRFGKIQVTCEGYDYPNDPYVLRGSCGLEYTIDFTEAGKRRQGSSHWWGSSSSKPVDHHVRNDTSWFFLIVVVAIVVFIIYKMSPNNERSDNFPTPDSDRPSHFNDRPSGGGSHTPPPYGFKPGYSNTRSRTPPPTYEDVRQDYSTSTRTEARNDGAGFWTGMGLGGLAGYLFGSRNNRGYGYSRNYGYGYGNGYGGGYGGSTVFGSGYGSQYPNYGSSWGSSWGGSSVRRRDDSSSSRNATGFGGTTRR